MLNKFTDSNLEREYRRHYDKENIPFLRLGTILSLIVWIFINLSSFYVIPERAERIAALTAVSVYPACIGALVILYVKRLSRIHHITAALVNVITAIFLLYVSFTQYYHQIFLSAGMLLMLLYAFFIFRLRMPVAITAASMYISAYQALLFMIALPAVDFFISSTIIWLSLLAIIPGAWYLDSTKRKLFLSMRMLLDRNSIIEKDLIIGRMIIDRFLPGASSQGKGCKVHTLYQPMDQVGGDFYDYKTYRGKQIFLVADVSGHGLASSYLALITKNAFDGLDQSMSPSRKLSLLNDAVFQATVECNYVTAIICEIDRDSKVMNYGSAGHPPCLLYRRESGEIIQLKASGKPLGWFMGTRYGERSMDIRGGDRVLLFTDGIVESQDRDGILFGDERLHAFIAARGGLEAGIFTGELLSLLEQYAGETKRQDDITLMVIDIEEQI